MSIQINTAILPRSYCPQIVIPYYIRFAINLENINRQREILNGKKLSVRLDLQINYIAKILGRLFIRVTTIK